MNYLFNRKAFSESGHLNITYLETAIIYNIFFALNYLCPLNKLIYKTFSAIGLLIFHKYKIWEYYWKFKILSETK